MKRILFFTFMSSIILISCNLFNSGGKKPAPQPFPEDMELEAKSVVASNNEFGFDLFKKLYQDNSAENMMISPTSISLALAMTYNGAEGETQTAFENTLHLTDLSRDQINTIYKNLQNYLKRTDPKIRLNIANSVWSKQGTNVEEEFKKNIREFYNAEFHIKNFSDPSTLNTINNWVEDNTEGKIQNILNKIDSDAFMYLINAIYFKGEWTNPFDVKNTYSGIFTNEEGVTSTANYMTTSMQANHLNNDIFTALELPYGNKDYSMVILLPNENKKIADIVDQLNDSNWNQWMSSFSRPELNVHLPKFKFKYKQELNDVLIQLGLENPFSDAANFSGISKDSPLKVSRVIHQSFIEVNEEGTEAAAATVVQVGVTSAGPPNVIKLNKPFFFAIKEKQTNSIVFMGTLRKP
ncbi:serpin family protein [Ancylomarina salipaludis]|uniref:Serpin family protein n=1 Tax=Ancylomarina salipaludis TaxID=2501299 RepID=A0A4Q1JJ45_9BACT|nr:serpin family protein [Ancylomarina salipaludis]RXQ90377.1 serpin family protein [Ancylomarina salipaludis]